MSSIFLTKKLHFLNGENIQNKNGIDKGSNNLQVLRRRLPEQRVFSKENSATSFRSRQNS